MKSIIDQILKENKLSLTEGRRKILEIFLKADHALVHNDIEKEFTGSIDRVSVYRTLQSFLKKGLIHLIPTTDNSIKYALTKEDVKQGQTQDHHVHFVCSNCNKTICLDEVELPTIKLPAGYIQEDYQMVISGSCDDC